MDANSILHHANDLFEKYPKKPDYRMTILNRLFIGMLHSRINKPVENYTDLLGCIQGIQKKCSCRQEKFFFINLYEATKESDLRLNEIDLPELSGYIKRAKQYQPEAFPSA